jgi:hypothetical protein
MGDEAAKPIIVDIPNIGPVEFPATMTEDEINAAAKKLHDSANKEPVVEKESPELMGYLGGGAGAVGAAGDVIYSKGRPLIRMGEKLLGMQTEVPPKPRTFLDPSTVAQQAIERRMPTDVVPEGSTTTVRNWTVGKPGAGTGQFGGQEFLGGANYKEANKIAEQALAAEKQFPGTKVLPGSLLSVPEAEAKNLAEQKAALAAEQDRLNQAEVQKVAQTRAERLGERANLRHQVARKNIATGAGTIATKVGAPILGGYELGSQGAQAYNRLTRPDLTASDIAAGATNIVGAGAGALSMLPGKYRIPAAILAQGAGAVANWLDKRNPRNEEEQKASGGLVQHFEKGGVTLAKKFVSGYLEHTPKKPNPLVGTRFELQDLGGVNPVVPLDLTKIKGAMMTPSPADMTSANQKILNIAGIPMTSDIVTHGGHPFARSQKNIERGHGWASNENAAKSAQSRADIAATEGEMQGGTGQALMLPMTMGKGSENFSVPVAQTYYDILKQTEFNPNELQKMNEEIRNYKIRGKTPLQSFVGLEHPEVMEQFLKGGMGLEGSHHDLRKAFVERAQLKDRMRAMGVNAEDIAGAHLDPNLLSVPQGYAGHTVLESKPGAEILPSDSITYSHALQKKYLGDIGNTPVSVLMEKPYKNIYQELEAKFPDKTEDQIHAMTLGAMGTRKAGVSQLVDEETINRVGAYHDAVKQGLIDPNDHKAAMEYLSVPGRYAGGGKIGALETLVKPLVNRINMHHKDVLERIPQLQESAQQLMAGTGSREAHEALVNAHKPVTPFDFVPRPATAEEAINALSKDKKELYGVPSQTLQAGHPVGLRLDIPAYSSKGVWVPTVHEQKPGFGAGTAIGHESVAAVTNPMFGMSDKAALSIASGKPKGTIATIKGDWKPTDTDTAVANAQEYLNHPDWRQVGMDPERHGYFYDRETMEPITHAEEALQIGPLVLAKKPVYGKKEDFKFAAGGLAQAFDPEGKDYDYSTALAHGMGPDGTGENAGHWGSVAPAPEHARQQYNLPEDSYVVLKGKSHPTFHKAEAAENERGSEIVKLGDRYYSIPKK